MHSRILFCFFCNKCYGHRTCQSDIRFNETSTRELGFKIAVTCKCGVKYINSCPLIDKSFEINRRIVIVMRLLGIGKKGINLFCNLMDIGQGLHIKIFYACLENIHCASKAIYELVTKKAVEEEKQKNVENNYPIENLTISGDNWWKKQCFSLFFRIFAFFGIFSKKVLDTEIKS